ncbi:zinc finger MYM-type protein 5-like [Limulus polyphemus]|uniref:Zinc finger MYM-type protein 5-like n=1 Tax=Limulus polyphemus TaxID=6850 RepID=A0ABM1BLW6_LIMPO|nr:zinc finger MYM-type protein 5-like [Limulus polyphemus]
MGRIKCDVVYFPTNKAGRHFSVEYFKRKLLNGELIHRRWLMYSNSADAVYCSACKLFTLPTATSSGLAKEGIQDWKNISAKLSEHEQGKDHTDAMMNWIELYKILKKGKTINEIDGQLVKSDKCHWQMVIEHIFTITTYLAQHNMTFRGNWDKLFIPNNGNFLALVQLFVKFNPIMKEHS